MVSPSDHPNTSAALIVGWVASALVYGGHRAGIDLTPEDATYGATALIGLVLFLGKNRGSTPTPPPE
jgi:hypothetical protein